VLGLALAAGLLATAWIRSCQARVMVVNKSGATVENVRVDYGRREALLGALEDGDSARVVLALGRDEELSVAVWVDGAEVWHGGPVGGGRGDRVIVRLDRAGAVEGTIVTDWWHSLLGPSGAAE
jgi:hypothetical protein